MSFNEAPIRDLDVIGQFFETSYCYKCAGDDVWATFHARGEVGSRCWPYLADEEHICRGCRRCQHEWIEWPIDRSGEPDE